MEIKEGRETQRELRGGGGDMEQKVKNMEMSTVIKKCGL